MNVKTLPGRAPRYADAPNPRDYVVWTIGMLKGGVGKTITAYFLAFALAALGYDVLYVDADRGSESGIGWANRVYRAGGELPFDVVQWDYSCGPITKYIADQQRAKGSQIVIVDLGGKADSDLEDMAHISDLVIAPVGADLVETDNLTRTRAQVATSGAVLRVLATRQDARHMDASKSRNSVQAALRSSLAANGYQVYGTAIPGVSSRYSAWYGHVVTDTGAYGDLVNEIINERTSA